MITKQRPNYFKSRHPELEIAATRKRLIGNYVMFGLLLLIVAGIIWGMGREL
ncbi:hypothetical protein GCM10027080_05700 [Pedococcus soli]